MDAKLPGIRLDRKGIKEGDLSKATGEALIGAARLAAAAVDPTQAIGAFGNFFKSYGEIKPKESPGRLAFLLVTVSLARCFEEMARDVGFNSSAGPDQLKILSREMLDRLDAKPFSIDEAFFISPGQFPFLAEFARLIYDRLISPSKKPSIDDLTKLLRRHFAVALYLAVMDRPEAFKPLQERLFSQANEPARRELERRNYQAGLVRAFEGMPLMGQEVEEDPVLLGQIYVPLRAWHYLPIEKKKVELTSKRSLQSSTEGDDAKEKLRKKLLVDFETHALEWAIKADPKYPIMVLSGGPGMGKSSSLRSLAAGMVRQGNGFPVFIPLQFMEDQTTLEDRIHHVLLERTPDSPLKHNLLKHVDEAIIDGPIVLMFDGLDELVLSGEGDDKPLRDLVTKVEIYLNSKNTGRAKARVLAMIAGRIGAADRATSQMDLAETQLLNFLPLVLSDTETWGFVEDTPKEKLHHDQRSDWWKRWHARRPTHPKRIPEQLESHDLTPLSREPLLLYFLVFSEVWAEASKNGAINRNDVYDRVLREFHKRECKKEYNSLGKRFRDFGKQFEPVLQSLAIASWYDGSTRKGTMDDAFAAIERIDYKLIEPFREQVGDDAAFGASLAFHLRPIDGKNTYEFLHKSFAEYLVARRFVSSISALPELLRPRAGEPPALEAVLKGWLGEWGMQSIDTDLLRFIRDEAARQVAADGDVFSECRASLTRLLEFAQIAGLPAHQHLGLTKASRKIDNFAGMTDLARNAEEALLVGLNASLKGAPIESLPISLWSADQRVKAADVLFTRLRLNLGLGFVGHFCLDRLDLKASQLWGSILLDASLKKADLSEAVLIRILLLRADLTEANLASANLALADLQDAEFTMANLTKANLSRATLRGANFTLADLRNANLSDSYSLIEALGLRQALHLDKARLPKDWSVKWNKKHKAWDITTPEGPYVDPREREKRPTRPEPPAPAA